MILIWVSYSDSWLVILQFCISFYTYKVGLYRKEELFFLPYLFFYLYLCAHEFLLDAIDAILSVTLIFRFVA